MTRSYVQTFVFMALFMSCFAMVPTTALAQRNGDRYGCTKAVPGFSGQTQQAMCSSVARQADPFVFCSEGMPSEGLWASVNPLQGLWMPLYYEWDSTWIPTFETVCPRVRALEPWLGKRPANQTPITH